VRGLLDDGGQNGVQGDGADEEAADLVDGGEKPVLCVEIDLVFQDGGFCFSFVLAVFWLMRVLGGGFPSPHSSNTLFIA